MHKLSLDERAEPTPILHTKAEAALMLSIGMTKLQELVAAGKIKRVKIGERALFPRSELERYVAELVAAE
jgi:excisionase family DNA binding protein